MTKRITGYLILVLFVVVTFKTQAYALKLDIKPPQEVDESNMNNAGLISDNKNIPEEIVRPNVEYKAQGLRNPFEQPALVSEPDNVEGGIIIKPEAGELAQLTVQGIIWGGNLPQAIINNKVVKVGDVLEGAEIVDINKEGVTVLFAGIDYKLTTLSAITKSSGK